MLLGPAAAPAADVPPGLTCPLDGTPVAWPEFLAGNQAGVRFDLKPEGEGPLLPPLPRCGRCGLVFDPEGKSEHDLELGRAVASPAYQEALATPSGRYRRAVLLSLLPTDETARARAWLEAAWELEGADEGLRRRSLERALAAYRAVSASLPTGDPAPRALRQHEAGLGDEARTAALLVVELLRLLGRFEEATAALERLAGRPEFRRGVYAHLLPRERTLLASHDAAPRTIPPAPPRDPDDDDEGFLAARALPGWGSVEGAFTLESVSSGYINLKPRSLFVSLRATSPRLVNAARWYDLLGADDRPRFSWGDFVWAQRRAETLAGRHPWLAAWKRLVPGHTIELQAVGRDPWAEDLDGWVMAPWRDAGLPGRPAVELLLRTGHQGCATLFLDEAGKAGVLTRASGCGKAGHWLDELRVSYHPAGKPPSYVLVHADGRWELRTMGAPAPSRRPEGERRP